MIFRKAIFADDLRVACVTSWAFIDRSWIPGRCSTIPGKHRGRSPPKIRPASPLRSRRFSGILNHRVKMKKRAINLPELAKKAEKAMRIAVSKVLEEHRSK